MLDWLTRIFDAGDAMPPWLPVGAAGVAALLVVVAEVFHTRRTRRLGRLAFGDAGRPRRWVALVPVARALAVAAVAWGLLTLWRLDPRTTAAESGGPDAALRRILIVLDVSPSMHLTDGGPALDAMRSERAGDVVMNALSRVSLERARVSVVAFYTDAKPVVVDTVDPDVVANIMSGLPLDQAFEHGKTDVIGGIKAGYDLARDWRPGSATLLLVSDGDAVPPTGLPPAPPAVGRSIVVGVGDPRQGRFIDGHQSRQDAPTLRQLAVRLGGDYHDANATFLPSGLLDDVAGEMAMRSEAAVGTREWAMAAAVGGGAVSAIIPVALSAFGAPGARRGDRLTTHAGAKRSAAPGGVRTRHATRGGAALGPGVGHLTSDRSSLRA